MRILISRERALEAWLATGGKWAAMLLFLARRPGESTPTEWWTRHKNGGTHHYTCNVCSERFTSKSTSARLHPLKAMAAHAKSHLDELEQLLDMKRNE